MKNCEVYLKSGNTIIAEYQEDEWDDICEAFLGNKSVLIFNNCQIRSTEIEAIFYS
jgi:hypothetical protein